MPHDLRSEKIAILAGGPSCEREISLISGQTVFEALRSKGLDVFLLDPVPGFVESLKKKHVTMVFIALHGGFGEDGVVQELLENEGFLYTGSSAQASHLAFDKPRAQALFKKEGLWVPEFVELNDPERLEAARALGFPVVVKPAQAGSSVGVSILMEPGNLETACADAFRYSDTVLAERYIHGRELTVGILGGEALPVVEIVVRRKFYDYHAKYRDARTEYRSPADLTREQEARVRAAALRAYELLGCEVMARADIILDGSGRPYLLEVNTIPGLTGKSLLPKAAKAAGVDFPDLCVRILTLSAARERAEKWPKI